MKSISYRDYSFGEAILSIRTKMGLTQGELAQLLGVSRRAVGDWEAGKSYPNLEHFKQLVVLALEHNAFPAGSEAESIRALWHASHQKVLLDEAWLNELLGTSPIQTAPPAEVKRKEVSTGVHNLPHAAAPFVNRTRACMQNLKRGKWRQR